MLKLHPQFVTKKGKKEFVVLPYDEFAALQELLEDVQDLMTLRKAKEDEGDIPSISLEKVKEELGL